MKGNKCHYPELMVHPGDCWNWPSSASWKSLLWSTSKYTKCRQITEFVYSRSECDVLPSVRGSVVESGSMWAAEGLLLVIHSGAGPLRWTASPSHGELMERGAPHWRYWRERGRYFRQSLTVSVHFFSWNFLLYCYCSRYGNCWLICTAHWK